MKESRHAAMCSNVYRSDEIFRRWPWPNTYPSIAPRCSQPKSADFRAASRRLLLHAPQANTLNFSTAFLKQETTKKSEKKMYGNLHADETSKQTTREHKHCEKACHCYSHAPAFPTKTKTISERKLH